MNLEEGEEFDIETLEYSLSRVGVRKIGGENRVAYREPQTNADIFNESGIGYYYLMRSLENGTMVFEGRISPTEYWQHPRS